MTLPKACYFPSTSGLCASEKVDSNHQTKLCFGSWIWSQRVLTGMRREDVCEATTASATRWIEEDKN